MAESVNPTFNMAAVKDLIPYARNTRTHSDEQVNQIVSSIKEFGFTNPVLIDEENMIIAGHGRVLAANKLKLKKIPTVSLTHLTEAQKRAYIIADNRLALNAGWDEDMLRVELQDLDSLDFDINLLGFDEREIDSLLSSVNDGLTDEDAVPELPEEPTTKLGDLWLLGEHRLLCGDSTSIDAVDKLMGGQLADMVFTDPPYNVNYGGGRARGKHIKFKRGGGIKSHGTILNDDMTPEEFDDFIRDAFVTYMSFMKPLSPIYVCHPDSKSKAKITFEREFAECFKKSATIIWDKGHAGLGYADYRSSHEPILYGWKDGKGSHRWYGDKTKTTVWSVSKGNTGDYLHPTQKPVALVEEAILNSSKGMDIVLDLFGGSGSTMVAAEKTGRTSYLMELDPKYCDVIVERWEDFTGKKAELSDG